jgi:CDP-glucose 4,6-dehydratase
MTDAAWRGRLVLVTGAAGLLGGWVSRRLAQAGAQVLGLDIEWSQGVILGPDDPVERIDGDIRDREAMDAVLADRNPDTLIHLAAQAIVGRANEDPADTFEHNALGTWVTLDACRRNGGVRRIVVASSDKAYGDHGGAPYEESMPLLARHPYAASKTCTDIIAQTYAISYAMPLVVTRCGNLYGGGDVQWSRIVPGTIRSVLRGERPVIRSDGHFVRDYLYVEDAAEGVLALGSTAGERPELAGEAFNLSGESRCSVLDIVGRILRLMDSDLEPVILDEAVNEIRDQRVSAEKARTTVGWMPNHTLDDGLEATIAWYRTHLGMHE